MKRFCLPLLLFLITGCEISPQRQQHADVSPEQPGKQCIMIRVVDGDTIFVEFEGEQEYVRLLCINTPERKQPGYQDAKDALTKLLNGQVISIEFETPNKIKRDRYKRLLAYVWVDGKLANAEMVHAGHTKYWTKYGKGKYAALIEGKG